MTQVRFFFVMPKFFMIYFKKKKRKGERENLEKFKKNERFECIVSFYQANLDLI